MPAPYQTNCLDYNLIGCKSRSDCINKCNIETSIKQCNWLPISTNVNKHNDQETYNISSCTHQYDYNENVCEDKYKLPDWMNEYYTIKPVSDSNINQSWDIKYMMDNYVTKFVNHTQQISDKTLSTVTISFGDEPDTIYTHSPQQPIVEFICFICGVISMWTGISVFSLYAYGNRFIKKRKQFNQKSKAFFIRRNAIDSNC